MRVNQLLAPKYLALERFTERLLSGDTRDQIAKMILFGSVVRGDAERHSDVDVLVFGFGDLDRLSEICAEISLDVGIESGEIVQPLVYSVDDLLHPQSYFLHRAIREGKEVYEMDDNEFRDKELKDHLLVAQEYLEAAKISLADGKYRVAIDTAYNAAELCTRGLLLLKLPEIPGSHGGLIARFGEIYIVSGLMPKKTGRDLNVMMELRNKARYDTHSLIGEKEARSAIELAETLMKALEDTAESG